MKLIKRFRSYLIGFAIGILMVMFIFKDRANLFTSWLPENRVLIEIYQDSLVTSNLAKCQLECIGKSVESFRESLKDSSTIEFSQSDTRTNPRSYCLMQDVNGISTQFTILMQDSISTIAVLKGDVVKNCDCQ